MDAGPSSHTSQGKKRTGLTESSLRVTLHYLITFLS